MPQSMSLNTPPSSSNKRQRSRESRNEPSRPTSAGEPAPTSMTEEEKLARTGVRIPAYLNKSRTEIQVSFQDLEWKQRYRMAGAMSNSDSPFKIDRSLTVTTRNRYGNVQPWENARIKLNTPIHGSDYINASPIKLRSLRHTGPQRGRAAPSNPDADTQSSSFESSTYIATQGPKLDQFSHFWHMVMQQSTGDVGVIIMLTQFYEGPKEKCAQYFPLAMEDPKITINPEPTERIVPPAPAPSTREDGTQETTPIENEDGNGMLASLASTTNAPAIESTDRTEPGTVTLVSLNHDHTTGSEVRELQLTIGSRTKTIWHYFYGSWADFGKPEAEDRIALLQLMRTTRLVARGSGGEGSESPRIVHCSAGVGRTGTWIALDYLLRECEEGRFVERSLPASSASSTQADTNEPSAAQEEVVISKKSKSKSKSKSRSRSRKPSSTQNLSEASAAKTEPGVMTGKSAATWGKSGPPKTTTPEPRDVDLIHDTVDGLRVQRMMMVMNEVQYAFLYEAVREIFVRMYMEKEAGVVVTTAAAEGEPSLKVPRVDGGGENVVVGGVVGQDVYDGTRVGQIRADEDTVSEAETEIQDDPYAAVAPENIRSEVQKMEQPEVGDHEVQ